MAGRGGRALEIPAIPRHTLENLVGGGRRMLRRRSAGGASAFPDSWTPVRARAGEKWCELPGLCVIDDTYNANPAAVRVALDNLVRVAARWGGRPVAVLGDMRELGPRSGSIHRQTGEYAAAAGVEFVWGVGALSESTVEGFRDASARPSRSTAAAAAGHVASPAETSPVVASLRPGDVVLFKASRGVRLEEMVDAVSGQARAGRWTSETGEATAGQHSEDRDSNDDQDPRSNARRDGHRHDGGPAVHPLAAEAGHRAEHPGGRPGAPHSRNRGRPPWAGILILVAALIPYLIFAEKHWHSLVVIILTYGSGAIGLADDLLKQRRQRSLGLSAKVKLALQVPLVAVAVFLALRYGGADTKLMVPLIEQGLEIRLALLHLRLPSHRRFLATP